MYWEAIEQISAQSLSTWMQCILACTSGWRIVEIVGGHIDHPDISYRSQFAAGTVNNILGYNRFHHSLGLRQRQVLPRLWDGNNEGFAAGGKKS